MKYSGDAGTLGASEKGRGKTLIRFPQARMTGDRLHWQSASAPRRPWIHPVRNFVKKGGNIVANDIALEAIVETN